MLVFPQIFDDADKSELSCIIVDDIERLLGSILSNLLYLLFLFFLSEKFVTAYQGIWRRSLYCNPLFLQKPIFFSKKLCKVGHKTEKAKKMPLIFLKHTGITI